MYEAESFPALDPGMLTLIAAVTAFAAGNAEGMSIRVALRLLLNANAAFNNERLQLETVIRSCLTVQV